jgi:hypothetical protein
MPAVSLSADSIGPEATECLRIGCDWELQAAMNPPIATAEISTEVRITLRRRFR